MSKQTLTALKDRSLPILIGGQLITAVAGLIYGKLTAIYISPAVWGEYSLWLATMTLVHGLFVTPTLQSFKAALGQYPQQQIISFYRKLLTRAYLVLFIPILLAGLYYQRPVFGLIWIAAIGQGFYQFSSNYLNASGQHRRYALMQASYAIGIVLVFIWLVIGLNQRTVSGLWQALMLVNLVFAIVAVWLFLRTNKEAGYSVTLTEPTALLHSYKQYVWPLVSLTFWSWLINYADRYLLRLYLTEEAVGQYGMGYSLGAKLLVLVAPLLAFLSPQILQLRAAGQSPQTANVLLRRYVVQYILLAGAGCFIFYLSREWIGQLLLSDHYKPAFLIGPIVAIGYLFLTSIHLLELKWYAYGQTHYMLWHNIWGALLNIGFNLLLIPRLGILGAALATLLGFAGQFLLAVGLFISTRMNNS